VDTGPPGAVPDDEISEETLLVVAQVRTKAAQIPLGPGIASLTAEVLAVSAPVPAGEDMTPAEIRRLAASAIEQAQQVSFLLGRLAGLLGERNAP
jgi:hypothetical protein